MPSLAMQLRDFFKAYSPEQFEGKSDEAALAETTRQLSDTLSVSEMISEISLIIPEENLTAAQLAEANGLIAALKAILPAELRREYEDEAPAEEPVTEPEISAAGTEQPPVEAEPQEETGASAPEAAESEKQAEPNLVPNVEQYIALKAQHPNKLVGVQVDRYNVIQISIKSGRGQLDCRKARGRIRLY